MKLTQKKIHIIMIIIACIIIALGLLQGVFHINIDENTSKNISSALMIIAAALFLYGKKRRAQNEKEEENDENSNE